MMRPRVLVLQKKISDEVWLFLRNLTIFVASREWSVIAQADADMPNGAKNLFKFWNIVPIMVTNNTRQGYVFDSLARIESNLKLAGYLFLAFLKSLPIFNKLGLL